MTTRRVGLTVALASVALLNAANMAFAHPGHGSGLSDGLLHAFTGLDHLLAMVAVGLLAARIGGRGLWMVPAAFMGSMLVGAVAATMSFRLPGAEMGVLASLLAFGAMLVARRAADLGWGVALVVLFAIFHGYVHIHEMATSEMLVPSAAGMLLSTGLLHACGIALAMLLNRVWRTDAVRFVGAAIATCGVFLFAGWL